ncbi:hypothetical protein BLNAU_19784 [Blattamonas nauphoetae]|uniref:Uncharacterized protein n=1 Tax=Blattamonas nauphoetae TaxID=2049346 RepID=A0ABQ9X135_9EUKA|nr:hypothetical protein BLNAU_19784 [Blattamonas nauphoetae]
MTMLPFSCFVSLGFVVADFEWFALVSIGKNMNIYMNNNDEHDQILKMTLHGKCIVASTLSVSILVNQIPLYIQIKIMRSLSFNLIKRFLLPMKLRQKIHEVGKYQLIEPPKIPVTMAELAIQSQLRKTSEYNSYTRESRI